MILVSSILRWVFKFLPFLVLLEDDYVNFDFLIAEHDPLIFPQCELYQCILFGEDFAFFFN